MLRCVARTSLATKLAPHLAEQLTDIVTDAVLTIRQPDQPLDLYMVRVCPASVACVAQQAAGAVGRLAGHAQGATHACDRQRPHSHTPSCTQVEIMHMRHKLDQDTRLVKGLVLDHGARHPDMPKRVEVRLAARARGAPRALWFGARAAAGV
jgi:T-complex protein 1 subunit zeta